MPAKRNKRTSKGTYLPYPKDKDCIPSRCDVARTRSGSIYRSEASLRSPHLPVLPVDKKVIIHPLGVSTPLENFFSQYTKFRYRPLNSPVAEFKRLCEEHTWGKRSEKKKKDAREKFNVAIKEEFGDLYGSDEKDVKNWQKLCHVLRIDPVPGTLQGCRAAVLRKHVNLVDLVQGDKLKVTIFETEGALSEYTKETEKFFPKESAVDGGVLRALRRHILSPREHGGPASKRRLGKSRFHSK